MTQILKYVLLEIKTIFIIKKATPFFKNVAFMIKIISFKHTFSESFP